LPEVATNLASVVQINAPDLALGNVLGSNNFNLMIIVLLDFLYKGGSVIKKAGLKSSHILSAGFTIVLSALVAGGIFISSRADIWSIGNVGVDSIAVGLIYIIGMRLIFNTEVKQGSADSIEKKITLIHSKKPTLSSACLGFVIAASLVVAGAVWLANTGDKIAELTGLGRTFVGSIFLALVTSFPELVVSVTAFKLGSIELAFGNIFGSNMINLFIIPLTDIAYRKAVISASVSQTHILTAFLGIFLTCFVVIGLSCGVNKKVFLNLSRETIAMALSYVLGTYLLFRLK